MSCKINNNSDYDITEIEDLIQDLFTFSQDRLGFEKSPVLNLVSDKSNNSPLGKTAYYDPNNMEITIYVDGRHPKDIMRSFSHELVHHNQNLKGEFANIVGQGGSNYAQTNPHLRKMEKEAYLKGNMCFRDWEDGYKSSNPNILNERRIYKMSVKDWKDKELNTLLNERWGFSMNLDKLNESKKQYDLEDGHDRIFAPNHYCLHHVIYEGKEGKTVDHNWDERLQKVTKYDVKFKDGSIIRNIHESKLTVLEAFTEADHSGKRDEHPPVKKEEKEEEPKKEKKSFTGKKNMVKDPKTGKMVPDYAIDGKGAKDLKEEEKEDKKEKFKKGLKGELDDSSSQKVDPKLKQKILDSLTVSQLKAALAKKEKKESKLREAVRRAIKSKLRKK